MTKQDSSKKYLLRPAFSSTTQIVSFILLLIFALLLPIFITETGKINRSDSYDLMSEEYGAYSFIKSEIFENNDDIDILFVGSSIQWNAIDTPQVQQALSNAIGRKARVVSFGFNFNGIDIPYVILRDVIARKHVRLVVFSIPRLPFNDGPNAIAYKFLRYNDYDSDAADLPFKYRMALFASNVLRSPHDLLTLLRKNSSKSSKQTVYLGANKELMGMGRDPRKFVRFVPTSPAISNEQLIFSNANKDRFEFTNEYLPPYQEYYLNELISLLRNNRIPLAMVNVPQYNERMNSRVTERSDWAAKFGEDIPLVGVAPTTLFAGLTPEEVELLHCDQYHFNSNGGEFFTRTILPAIVEVYEKYATKEF